MTALAKIARGQQHEAPQAGVSAEDSGTLALFRLAALRCRAAARLDLFRACEMLSADRSAAAETAADALLRTLGQALGRSPRLFRPGAGEASFDERWLVALVRALREGDEASATFLLHSRVPQHCRRSVAFLCGRVAAGTPRSTVGSHAPT